MASNKVYLLDKKVGQLYILSITNTSFIKLYYFIQLKLQSIMTNDLKEEGI